MLLSHCFKYVNNCIEFDVINFNGQFLNIIKSVLCKKSIVVLLQLLQIANLGT